MYLEGPCHPLTQPDPASGGQQGLDTDLQLPNLCQAYVLQPVWFSSSSQEDFVS